MRKIKFRLFENGVMMYPGDRPFYISPWGIPIYETIIDAVVMQYTGLKDKNGTEIYEGDIYDNGLRKFVVEYDEERAGFFPFAKDDGCGCCSDEVVWHPESDEVIGNIYENPELLEVTE